MKEDCLTTKPKRDRRQPHRRKEGSRMQGQFYVRLYSISLSLQETGVCRNIDNIRSIEGLKDMYSLANRYNMCFLLTLLRHLLAEFYLHIESIKIFANPSVIISTARCSNRTRLLSRIQSIHPIPSIHPIQLIAFEHYKRVLKTSKDF